MKTITTTKLGQYHNLIASTMNFQVNPASLTVFDFPCLKAALEEMTEVKATVNNEKETLVMEQKYASVFKLPEANATALLELFLSEDGFSFDDSYESLARPELSQKIRYISGLLPAEGKKPVSNQIKDGDTTLDFKYNPTMLILTELALGGEFPASLEVFGTYEPATGAIRSGIQDNELIVLSDSETSDVRLEALYRMNVETLFEMLSDSDEKVNSLLFESLADIAEEHEAARNKFLEGVGKGEYRFTPLRGGETFEFIPWMNFIGKNPNIRTTSISPFEYNDVELNLEKPWENLRGFLANMFFGMTALEAQDPSIEYKFPVMAVGAFYYEEKPLSAFGNVDYLNVETKVKGLNPIEELRAKFQIGTFEDEEMAKDMETARLPKLVVEWAEYIYNSYGSKVGTLSNFQLSGDPGAGKSFMTKIFAHVLGLPHYSEVGSSDKLTSSDWFARMQPRTADAVDMSAKEGGQFQQLLDIYEENGLFVDEDMIEEVPDYAYLELMGQNVPQGTDVDSKAFKSYLKRQLSFARKEVEEKSTKLVPVNDDFVVVLTQLGQVAMYGGVIDIQEVDMARDVAQVSGLYGFLEERQFELPGGQIVKRHPDSFVFFTNNASGPSCSPLPEAFISRMHLRKNFHNPDANTMASTVVAKTGIKKSDAVKMAKVILALQELAVSESVVDGSVGSRELLSWAKLYALTGNLEKTVIPTVQEKFSNDPEMLEEAQAVIKTHLASAKVGKTKPTKRLRQ